MKQSFNILTKAFILAFSFLILGCNPLTNSAKGELVPGTDEDLKSKSQSDYEILELERISENSFGLGINDNLQVAGYAGSPKHNLHTPIKWVNSNAVELGGFNQAFPFGEAEGINSDNYVVGRSTLKNRSIHAFIWSERFGMIDLGTLPTGGQSQAYSINDNNEVVGWSFSSSFSDQRAFLWDANNGMQSLGTLGGDQSAAYSINNRSIVVGNSAVKNGETHAFIWDSKHGMSDIGTLGGQMSVATDINNDDQVVGWSETNTGNIEAYIWDRRNGMRSLAKYFKRFGRPYAINDRGIITGEYQTTAGVTHAFTLDSNTGFFTDLGNLNGPSGNHSYGRDINNNGDVTGYISSGSSGSTTAVVWHK